MHILLEGLDYDTGRIALHGDRSASRVSTSAVGPAGGKRIAAKRNVREGVIACCISSCGGNRSSATHQCHCSSWQWLRGGAGRGRA
jgi:hypothetical protein